MTRHPVSYGTEFTTNSNKIAETRMETQAGHAALYLHRALRTDSGSTSNNSWRRSLIPQSLWTELSHFAKIAPLFVGRYQRLIGLFITQIHVTIAITTPASIKIGDLKPTVGQPGKLSLCFLLFLALRLLVRSKCASLN
jgi:hypothetical protein